MRRPIVVLLAFAAAIPAYYALPGGDGWRFVLFVGPLTAAVALLGRRLSRDGLWRQPPWRWLLAGLGVYLGATIVWAGVPLLLGDALPFPSVIDGLYFASYALFGWFLLGLTRTARSPAGDRDERVILIDTAILAVPLITVAWTAAIEHNLHADLSPEATATAIAYPAATIVLGTLGLRLFLLGSRSAVALLCLGWLAGEVAADVFYGYTSANGTFAFTSPQFAGWLFSYACLAAMSTVRELDPAPAGEGSWIRRTGLAVVMVGAVLTPLVASLVDGQPESVVLLAMGAAGFVLVVVRLALTGGSLERERRLNDALRELASDLDHAARHDGLTGLGNRLLLREHERGAVRERALVLADINQFKAVNDTFGHGVGDAVLRVTAERLRAVVRPGDIVVRLGGDEFAALVNDGGLEAARGVARRFLAAMRPPIETDGHPPLYLSASVGIAAGDAETSLAELMRRADASMYDAKRNGQHREVAVFNPDAHHHILDNLALASQLRGALAAGEFVLHYQPIVDLASRDTVGYEALVRWAHPERGLVPPGVFIELAEQNGLMPDLGQWVLHEACREAVRWSQGPGGAPYVSVNLSIRQLQENEFTGRFHEAVAAAGLPFDRIVVEVTETALAAQLATIGPKLADLRAQGVRVYTDDFGTGYSSLGYLRELPLDGVKLDRVFTQDLTTSDQAWSLVESVVRLLDHLGLVVVAEGVEDAAALAQLRSLGCHKAQGYYFGRPVPPAELPDRPTSSTTATLGGP